jgi:hypothetical protein
MGGVSAPLVFVGDRMKEKVRFITKYQSYAATIDSGEEYFRNGKQGCTKARVAYFDNGVYETSDELEIEALRSSKFCGIDYHEDVTNDDDVIETLDSEIKEESRMTWSEFRKKFYAENTGLGIKDCAAAWRKYKEEYK